ncbi:hypothetical protein [Amycolatopsis sp. DG1A-15b]|uniref:8-oxoguanine DNA glycosylase OGG fold protein n=1 Tax=Amycolatopsis sp. DG1A-15b TaxID=3052846 RepID=UPI00255BD521|nr:hypothetical protein [Amycolatopsis sp. DG1A-15b]WIX85676.1 hypothetical protein QRY02_31225 [Amycolatopsis sp. DG1A-15b]
MASVPFALITAVQRWRERGEPPQPPSRWSRGSWLKHFPQHHSFISALPERIDRAEATRHAAHAVTAEGAERAFLVAMIWGYGPVGYGPWRTARVLAENAHAASRLAEVARVALEHGGVAAFRDLADKRLRYLGVAFGTKYLRFVTAASSSKHAGTPILDAVVRRWLVTHAGTHLNIDEWRPVVYERYVALLTSWSTELALAADTVEELIFRSAISQTGSALWGEEWMRSDDPAPQLAASQAQSKLLELERLFEAADPRAAVEARRHLDELARIIEQGWDS